MIRILTPQDLDGLVKLDQASFEYAWPVHQISEELSHPDSLVLGYFDAEKLLSAVIVRIVAGEAWIFRIMSHPKARRQGFARQLIERLYVRYPQLYLEVEADNQAAIAFYQKSGFFTLSRRPKYYRNTTDALLMRRDNLDYELIALGNGQKYERFGRYKTIRPEPESTAILDTNWKADARCISVGRGKYSWDLSPDFVQPWQISYGKLIFELKLSTSKNIGVFSEQEENWRWLYQKIIAAPSANILNLFAYTGGATLVCAQAGASVCHVDAAKSAVTQASRNAQLSGLADKPIRWIVDDAIRFLKREIVRGRCYDGVILDPPPFGHTQNGNFAFNRQISELLQLCKQVVKPKPLLFLLNLYALQYTPKMAAELVAALFPGVKVESGELILQSSDRKQSLSCSVYARF